MYCKSEFELLVIVGIDCPPSQFLLIRAVAGRLQCTAQVAPQIAIGAAISADL